jgi:tetratricopeptide (TPR) repeat protein
LKSTVLNFRKHQYLEKSWKRRDLMNWIIILITSLLGICDIANASSRFGQMVFTFDSKRSVSVREFTGNSAIEIHFSKTSPDELEKINFYDDALVKRAIITDLGPSGAKLKLYLRDPSLKATVSQFLEPYRVAVDIYDRNYRTEVDPTTGLPLVPENRVSFSSTDNHSPRYDRFVGNSLSSGSSPNVFTRSPSTNPKSYTGHTEESPDKRMLVSPTASSNSKNISTYFKEQMSQVDAGRGKSWDAFPPYMYPLQTAIYQGRSNPAGFRKTLKQRGLSEGQAMAEYALKLFNFGHEKRALMAYQQVLRKEPLVFDEDPLHLWSLAEIHFGTGNQTLAGEYYTALISKHPGSPLSVLSKIRLLDIKALYALESNSSDSLKDLVPSLRKISSRGNSEIRLMLALREAYWSQPKKVDSKGYMPPLSESLYQTISTHYPNYESSKTGFLGATLVLNHLLNTPWSKDTSDFANEYFDKFSGKSGKPYTTILQANLTTKIENLLINLATDRKYLEAVETFESIPTNIKGIEANPVTSWALAESYRNLGNLKKSLPHYEQTASKADLGLAKLKASIWSAIISGSLVSELTDEALTPSKVQALKRKAAFHDEQASRIWNKLKPEDQKKFAVGTRLDPTTSDTGPGSWESNFSPTGSLIKFLKSLASRFTELGLEKDRATSIALMRKMKPVEFGDDIEAKLTWANELTQLADDYRKANRYLDAGRLYTEVAESSQNWERKSEALYKGGLLLYRAGRKDEALAALRSASQDGSNLFYQNLAKERLNQLEQ